MLDYSSVMIKYEAILCGVMQCGKLCFVQKQISNFFYKQNGNQKRNRINLTETQPGQTSFILICFCLFVCF